MTQVYLGLGSNIEAEKHICNALQRLSEEFGDLAISPVYESEAVGFEGDNFLNLVVGLRTDMPLLDIQKQIKQIEADNGRVRGEAKFSARTLDIDILTYGDFVGEQDGIQLPRDEIVKNAFVLLPLQELAPDGVHPELQKSYAQLWAEYDQSKQKLWVVAFDLV